MKRGIMLAIACALLVAPRAGAEDSPETRSATTFGVLQGGSLLGFDHERLVSDRVGLQVGGGAIGFDTGVTYHYRRGSSGARSRNVFLGFWHLGGTHDHLGLVGITHVWRSGRPFTAQLGVGARVYSHGADWDVPVAAIYSMGVCRTMGRPPRP